MELWLMQAVQSIHNPFLDALMQAASVLAEQVVLLLILAAVYWCFDKKAGQVIVASMLMSLCFNCGLKNVLQMPRPFELYPDNIRSLRVETATGYSFPSGHTQAISTFVTAFAAVYRKGWMYVIGAIALLLVAVSRVYLGVHFPKDVLFGAAFGIVSAIAFVTLLHKVPKRRWGILFLAAGLLFACFLPFSFGGEVELDFFKSFGAFIGYAVGIFLEERLVQFKTDVSWKKKALRYGAGLFCSGLAGLLIYLVLPWEMALFCAIRSCVLVVFVVFVCPWIFTRLNI